MAEAIHVKTLPSAVVSIERRGFSPYLNNGGTALGVSGPDYAIIAGDTRMSNGYSICSRDVPKIFNLTPSCALVSSGMQAEIQTLRKVLHARVTQYQQRHRKTITAPSVAQVLSLLHFYVVGGLDADGKGAVWGYDAVGSFERVPYVCTGTGSALVTSILDNQIGAKTQEFSEEAKRPSKNLEEALKIVKDAFISAGERDIYTGDYVDIAIVTKAGTRVERFNLKKD